MKELHFRTRARGISLRACTIISLVALALTAASAAWAGPVSATPGTIQGVITFNAPFVPNSMEVDARDSSNQYMATAQAAQNDPVNCSAGSQNWCYSIIVESALANAYYLRPIAYVNQSSPIFEANRVPFPGRSKGSRVYGLVNSRWNRVLEIRTGRVFDVIWITAIV